MTIRNKMLLGFLSISLIPIIIIALIALTIIQNALSSRAFSQLENIREVKKNQVITFIQERETDLSILMDTVDGLKQAAFNKLKSVQEDKKAQILNYFQKAAKDIEVISKSVTVARALKDFQSTWDSERILDLLLYHFFETEKYGDSLLKFSKIYGYYDLLLITRDGYIVYSSGQESEFFR